MFLFMALTQIPKISEREVLSEDIELKESFWTSESLVGTMVPIQQKFEEYIFDVKNIGTDLDTVLPPFKASAEQMKLVFNQPPKPWLPPRLLKKFNKMKKTQLRKQEMVNLIEDIAKISIEFYQIKPRKFIAVKFDGRVVESSDDKIELLLKIQGKKFDTPVFVWEVGSESFSGWRL